MTHDTGTWWGDPQERRNRIEENRRRSAERFALNPERGAETRCHLRGFMPCPDHLPAGSAWCHACCHGRPTYPCEHRVHYSPNLARNPHGYPVTHWTANRDLVTCYACRTTFRTEDVRRAA